MCKKHAYGDSSAFAQTAYMEGDDDDDVVYDYAPAA
nr:IRON MAN 7 [Lotus japonicus]